MENKKNKKVANIIFDIPLDERDFLAVEEACKVLENVGYEVYNELEDSGTPRPVRPKR